MRRGWPKNAGFHWDQAEPYIHPSNGKPSCRWCKGKVNPPKRNWCGDPGCLAAWTFRTRHSVFRSTVFARDKGVCADCGLDCHSLDIDAARAALWDHAESLRKSKATDPTSLAPLAAALVRALAWRVTNNVPVREPAWQVDHVVPLCRGGDCYLLSNLESRCVPCHKIRTARLNRELAAERRLAKSVPFKRLKQQRVRKRKAI